MEWRKGSKLSLDTVIMSYMPVNLELSRFIMSQELAESNSLPHFKIFYNLKGNFKNNVVYF